MSSLIRKIYKSNLSCDNSFFRISNNAVTFINPYAYTILRNYPELLKKIDYIFVDGLLFCIFYYIFTGKKIKRRSFDNTSLAKELFVYSSTTNDSVYFVGAAHEQIQKSINVIADSFPKMNIVGFRNGYFASESEMDSEISNINHVNPRYVIVGMGSLNQELFAIKLKNSGFRGSIFTCGGFLHQSSSGFNYFPVWINKINMRFMYRLFKEPAIIKRYVRVLFVFPFVFIYDMLFSNDLKFK